ncbi:hypothetical protein N866_13610 [Actinotalea ferrariae CF5-4]|uniref:D-alanyl-D-alanine carboxypeptidase-like core domain-containing protein n=1 Tax=Actinotalea ferrariae CF5-4 TaxID=948458 RepID=A0A021VW59_9CELL|nr:M15 family metallopeptidase [Actinotalea ferrariae]EYR64280.1 hypothetical protein N866_13610 [Actinotalea ferrariae CF5-4]
MSTNGRLDTSELAVIPGGTKMGGSALIRADLLPGLVGLQAAFAKRFAAPLRPTSAADGYRSYEVQVRTFLARYAPATTGVGPFSDVRWWQGRRYIRVAGASAAVPGTSNHGWAIAVDFADVGATGGTRWSWLMDAAPRFGFVNPLWARDGIPSNGSQEPWHWEGRTVPVSNYRTFLAGMGVTVPDLTRPDPLTPTDPEDDDMLHAIRNHDDSVGLVRPDGTLVPLTLNAYTVMRHAGLIREEPPKAPDGTIWNGLVAHTAQVRYAERLAAGDPVDEAAIAREVAALVAPAVVAALPDSAGITEDQARDIAADVTRTILRSA